MGSEGKGTRPDELRPARSLTPLLSADDLQLDIDIAARRVRVGTDLFVRLLDGRGDFAFRETPILDRQLHGQAEAAALARPDRHRAGDFRFGRVLLLLRGDIVEGPAEACGITGREQMLGRCRVGLARTTHCPRHGEVGLDRAVARLRMSIAPADRGGRRGKERLDLVHVASDPVSMRKSGHRDARRFPDIDRMPFGWANLAHAPERVNRRCGLAPRQREARESEPWFAAWSRVKSPPQNREETIAW